MSDLIDYLRALRPSVADGVSRPLRLVSGLASALLAASAVVTFSAGIWTNDWRWISQAFVLALVAIPFGIWSLP